MTEQGPGPTGGADRLDRHPLRGFHLIGLGAKEIAVLGVAAVGVAVYGLLLLAFRGITPSEIRTALRRRPGDAAVSADL